MAKLHKFRVLCASLLLGSVILGGCGGSAKVPEQAEHTSLIVDKDGTIQYRIVESFEKEYYNADDLKVMATKEVTEYNQKFTDPGRQVVLTNVSLREGQTPSVEVAYHLQNAEAFGDFFETPFFYGTVEEAVSAGYMFRDMNQVLQNAKKNKTIVSADIPGSYGAKHVLLVSTPARVYCPHKVLYVSEAAALSDDGSVDTTGVYSESFPVIILLDK